MSGSIYVTIENAGDMAIAMNLSFVPVRSLGSGLLQSPTQDHGVEAWIVPANCSVSELNLLTICLFQQDSIQKKRDVLPCQAAVPSLIAPIAGCVMEVMKQILYTSGSMLGLSTMFFVQINRLKLADTWPMSCCNWGEKPSCPAPLIGCWNFHVWQAHVSQAEGDTVISRNTMT